MPFFTRQEKPCGFKGLAGFEPSANRIGCVNSVVVTRPLPYSGGYLIDWIRKLLSLSGDADQSVWPEWK